jgi:hypothetical protein
MPKKFHIPGNESTHKLSGKLRSMSVPWRHTLELPELPTSLHQYYLRYFKVSYFNTNAHRLITLRGENTMPVDVSELPMDGRPDRGRLLALDQRDLDAGQRQACAESETRDALIEVD